MANHSFESINFAVAYINSVYNSSCLVNQDPIELVLVFRNYTNILGEILIVIGFHDYNMKQPFTYEIDKTGIKLKDIVKFYKNKGILSEDNITFMYKMMGEIELELS